MKKIFGLLFVMVLIFSIGFSSAHSDSDFSSAKKIIEDKISCDKLSNEDLEALGEYYMEQMHPGESHRRMDERMGGEGSEILKSVHVKMGKMFYCKEKFSMKEIMDRIDMKNMMKEMHDDEGMGNMMKEMHGDEDMGDIMKEMHGDEDMGDMMKEMHSGGMMGGGAISGMMGKLSARSSDMFEGVSLASMGFNRNSRGYLSAGNIFLIVLIASSVLLIVFLVRKMHTINNKEEK